jgi:hypothetical protein
MFYLGHFSFAEDTGEGAPDPWHGSFTCVAEASDVAAALDTFMRLIRALDRKEKVFSNVGEIFLDSCVELPAIPRAGVLSFIFFHPGMHTGGMSASLLGAAPRTGTAYRWQVEDDASTPEPVGIEPFIRFARASPVRKPAKRKSGPRLVPPMPFKGTIH